MKPKQETILKILIIAFIVCLPFEKRHIFGLNTQYQAISLYLSDILLAPLLILGWYTTRNITINPLIKRFLLIFGLILAISLFLAPRGTFNYYSYIKWLEFLALCTLFAKLVQNIDFRALALKTIVGSGIFQAIIAIKQFISQKSLGLHILGEPTISNSINGVAKIDIGDDKYIRAYGTFAHPNQLAAFLFVACATCFYLFLRAESKKQRIIYGLSLMLLTFGEFLTFSRVGIATLYIFFALMFLLLYKLAEQRIKDSAKQLALVVLITTIAAASILNPFLKARAELPAPTTYNRSLYNQTGLKIFKDHPVFGVGIGNIYPEMQKRINHTEEWQVQVPHNYFIIVSGETGILGLIIIVILFGYLIFRLFKKIKEQGTIENFYTVILLSILLGIILLMQFDHYFYTLQQTQLLLWLVIGMIIAEITNATNPVTES